MIRFAEVARRLMSSRHCQGPVTALSVRDRFPRIVKKWKSREETRKFFAEEEEILQSMIANMDTEKLEKIKVVSKFAS